jgi:hypothetical protein
VVAEFAWTDAVALPWSHDTDAGEPRHEPASGLLVDALTGDESVRQVIEGERTDDDAVRAWRTEARRFGWTPNRSAATAP